MTNKFAPFKRGFTVGAKLIWESDPIPTIEQAIDKSDWFQAIVVSAIQLERFGYFAIREHLSKLELKDKEGNAFNINEKDNKILNILEFAYLKQLAISLLCIRKIDLTDYELVLRIDDARNNFMHQRELKKYVTGKYAEAKYKPLVNEAIRILRDKLDAANKRLP